jgi:nitroreductase
VDALAAIGARRSNGRLVEPAPDGGDLEAILAAGALAPDHGGLRPFRFHVLRGPRMARFGEVLAGAYVARCLARGTEPVPAKTEKERTKLGRAPLVVVVSAVRTESEKVPWIEQQQAAAAACQNVLLAATALGYGSMWRTGDPVYDDTVKAALGLRPDDAIAGFLYLGTVPDDGALAKPPRLPDLTGLVHEWNP